MRVNLFSRGLIESVYDFCLWCTLWFGLSFQCREHSSNRRFLDEGKQGFEETISTSGALPPQYPDLISSSKVIIPLFDVLRPVLFLRCSHKRKIKVV